MANTPSNSVNESTTGIVGFTGSAFTATPVTQFNLIAGGATSSTVQNVSLGSAGQMLVSNGTGVLPSFNSILGFYGDGSDGSQTFDGSSVVLGITPSSNIYTLNRDILLGSSTINNGVTIITNGFRIFCNGTLTNNGTIQWNGNAGTNTGVFGAEVSNVNSSINIGDTGTGPSTNGGPGNTGAGSNGENANRDSFGGRGGSGGAGGSAGGAGGTLQALTPKLGTIRVLPNAIIANQLLPNTGYSFSCNFSTGGGGGGGDGVNKGGGGGGGAGIVIISSLLFAGTGNIQAIGGNGGDGATLGTNCGGGGGGGGGVVIIISRSIISNAISGQTISVAGGTKGNGTGLGSAGSDGNAGTKILLPN